MFIALPRPQAALASPGEKVGRSRASGTIQQNDKSQFGIRDL